MAPVRGDRPILVQVCETLADEKTRQREAGALETAMLEIGTAHGTIVTRSETGRLEVAGGTIEVLPAWRFLLTMSERPDSD